MTFYHGTSDLFPIKRFILPPTLTGTLREEWRKRDTDKVFFTSSLLSASGFAKKASKKYGGSPVIYIVTPIGDYYNSINSEFVADKARVLGIYNK